MENQFDFGTLEIVEKTFVRKPGEKRGQSFDWIKFRRYMSEKGKDKAEKAGEKFEPFVDTQFVLSDKAFEKLNIAEYAFTQAKTANGVILLVLEDRDDVKPPAKFLRESTKKDGTASEKGSIFTNTFFEEDLIEKGLLPKEEIGNFFLSLVDVTETYANRPAHVKGVYNVVVDTTVDAKAEAENDAAEGVGEGQPVADEQAQTAEGSDY